MAVAERAREPVSSAGPPAGATPAWRQVARSIVKHYVVRKVVRAVFIIYLVTTLTFFIVRLMPGNPIQVYIATMVSQYGISYTQARQMAASLFDINFNQPLIAQYWQYIGGLLHGNLGTSYLSQGTPVSVMLMEYVPWTLFSVGISLLISFVLGVALGLVMAYKRETVLDNVLSVFASIFSSVPNYLIAILIIVIFGVELKWFPVSATRGSLSPGIQPGFTWQFFSNALYHAALPIFTYVLTSVGGWMLTMKSSAVRALEEDYVMVARSRGLRPARIAGAYVARNAILPVFAQLTIAVGFVVGGSILIENIFVYQGVGWLLGNSINQRDYPVMQAIFLVITVSVIVANLVADLVYGKLDPRIKATRE